MVFDEWMCRYLGVAQREKTIPRDMYIKLPGEKVGELKVIQCIGDTVENEVSLCTLVSGNLKKYIEEKDFSKLYIQ